MRGTVDGGLAVHELPEVGREFLVGGVAAGPKGNAADRGYGVVVQVCNASGLGFVDQV